MAAVLGRPGQGQPSALGELLLERALDLVLFVAIDRSVARAARPFGDQEVPDLLPERFVLGCETEVHNGSQMLCNQAMGALINT